MKAAFGGFIPGFSKRRAGEWAAKTDFSDLPDRKESAVPNLEEVYNLNADLLRELGIDARELRDASTFSVAVTRVATVVRKALLAVMASPAASEPAFNRMELGRKFLAVVQSLQELARAVVSAEAASHPPGPGVPAERLTDPADPEFGAGPRPGSNYRGD